MNDEGKSRDAKRAAHLLLRFLDDVMRAVGRVELGDPGIAQLTLVEMRILSALAEAGTPVSLHDLARRTEAGEGQTGQATARLRALELAERAGGGRGSEREFVIASRGRRLLSYLENARQRAVEGFIARLDETQRLRVEGAAHLLGPDLDRLSKGMLAA
jgi:DNA-binding MarR family transcriptional regulator